MKNKIRSTSSAARMLSIAVLLFMMFSGSECNELLQEPAVPDAIIGNWKLVLQAGALQDICPDENVNFQSNGIALLTCPNSTQISRDFNVSNNVLNYTQSSVSYDVVFSNNSQTLELKGKNVSRDLTYQKLTMNEAPPVNQNGTPSTHSSEKTKEVTK
jgi:hypothetical protein